MTTDVETCPHCGADYSNPQPQGLGKWKPRHRCKFVAVDVIRKIVREEIRANARDSIMPSVSGQQQWSQDASEPTIKHFQDM